MIKAFIVISIAFVVVIIIFVCLGGSFNSQFWLTFLPGLMGNLAILAVALFLIETIFDRQRSDKLKETNASQTRMVLFLANRLAYLLLKHLSLATADEVKSDPALNFEFACARIKGIDLAAVFYEKLVATENREEFVDGFETILKRETEGLSKAFEKIYPRPDPSLIEIADGMAFSVGAFSVLKIVVGPFKDASNQAGTDKLKQEDLDLFLKLAYMNIGREVEKLQRNIIEVSDKAKGNKLFISLGRE